MPDPHIKIQLKLPDIVSAGKPVAGQLVISNTGDEIISLVSPHYNAALNIVLFDRYWNQLAPNSLGKVHVGFERISISPGQSKVFELSDLICTTGTSSMIFKPDPGIYYVVAVYHPGTERLPELSSYNVMTASNVVKLIVR